MKALNEKKIDAIFACVGGGGLLSGASTYLKAMDPSIKCYGVSASRTPAMYECLKAGEIVKIPPTVPSVADGNGGNLEKGSITFNILQKVCEEIILVEEEDIKQATRWFVETEHTVVEPTAAVALAGFMKRYKEFKGKNVVIIACGRNMDLGKMQTILAETKK